MLLIVGLGNPGNEYENTPHNMGRRCVFRFAEEHGFEAFHAEKKFNALVSEKTADGQKIIAVLPETFMNNSGDAVSAIAAFYKITAEGIWVLNDDADIPLGAIRIAFGGGSAGHHGIESIAEKLGTTDFWRFRIGIGQKEPLTIPLEAYVLQKDAIGTAAEKDIAAKVNNLLELALEKSLEEAQKNAD